MLLLLFAFLVQALNAGGVAQCSMDFFCPVSLIFNLLQHFDAFCTATATRIRGQLICFPVAEEPWNVQICYGSLDTQSGDLWCYARGRPVANGAWMRMVPHGIYSHSWLLFANLTHHLSGSIVDCNKQIQQQGDPNQQIWKPVLDFAVAGSCVPA